MANEVRLRSNFLFGTITDNPLSNVATTINGPTLSFLPVVDATNHLMLVLDPTGINGAPEIVKVTAHTAAATSVTVVRGQEGSAARAHQANETWYFAPVVSDYPQDSSTFAALAAGLYEGQPAYTITDNKNWFWDGTTWVPWTAGGMLTNGYAQIVANQAVTGANTDITGLTVTVSVPANRRIKLTGYYECQNTQAAVNQFYMRLFEGATQLAEAVIPLGVTGANQQFGTCNASAILTPSLGSHTYKVVGVVAITGGTVLATATTPAYILVEDIGSSL